jgi:hypothetical protein
MKLNYAMKNQKGVQGEGGTCSIYLVGGHQERLPASHRLLKTLIVAVVVCVDRSCSTRDLLQGCRGRGFHVLVGASKPAAQSTN